MKKFAFASLLLASFNTSAFTVEMNLERLSTWNDPTVTPKTIVAIDTKKLKTNVLDAFAQWTGGECPVNSDAVGFPVMSCQGMLMSVLHLYFDKVAGIDPVGQFWGPTDASGKRLKVDGLKQRVAVNFNPTCATFGTNTPCTAVTTPTVFEPLQIDFDHPVTRFATQFTFTWNSFLPFSTDMDVKVNGVSQGTYHNLSFGSNMLNIAAGPGEVINEIVLTPLNNSVPSGAAFGAFWYN